MTANDEATADVNRVQWLLGRAFSSSYAPREASEGEAWAEGLMTVFRQFQREGTVVLRYRTSIFLARRNNQP